MRILLIALLCVWSGICSAADNLIVITLDGLRWQELFRGYEEKMLENDKFTKHADLLIERYSGDNQQQRREQLMPFFWKTIAREGVMLGNRDKHSSVTVSNNWWFSYPGYNEILTGAADQSINSNKPVPNKNVTFLEWLNGIPAYQGRVAAFAGWDVFPAIISSDRSGVMVNAGFMPADWPGLSLRAQWLNTLQAQVPSPWHNVRLDAFTYGFAKEYLLQHKPRVMYIALGETDDFAHDGEYDQYLNAAHRSDRFIADLWATLQSMEQYRGKTNMLIAVDHGRGRVAEAWPHHASAEAVKTYFKDLSQFKNGIEGADEIWVAAIGPDVNAGGEMANIAPSQQNQLAATAIRLLGLNPQSFNNNIGKPLGEVLK